jgi:AcrR family transcriptional regulator
MAATRRSTEDDSRTRSALLDAAQQLMVEEGYAAVTTRRLAAASGLNKALVYYYFGTMDDLFIALFRRGAERSLEREADALTGPQPLWALWDRLRERTSNELTVELVALANHRKALRAEITEFSRRFREMQLARIGEALAGYGVDPEEWPVAAVVVTMAGVARFLLMEEAIDVRIGHPQAVELVERFIRSLEGERITSAARAG